MCRFDLEQQILDTWGIVEELELLNEAVLEKNISRDEISNILIGMARLYNLKFDKCFNLFEKLLAEKRI